MKVPPLQNLIVCVIPPQTIVRQCVLAAVSYVSVLCGAANAQSAPAAPPVSLSNAAQLTWPTAGGEIYTLEHSRDLTLWNAVTAPVFGDVNEASQVVPLPDAGAGAGYYRLKIAAQPREGKSRWSMAGCRMLLTTPAGSCSMTFDGDGLGRMDAVNAAAAFTWDWQRTGPDSGRATITWHGGVVELMNLNFTGKRAGVFQSRKFAGGAFAGAACGTFRDDDGTSLAQAAPVSLANKLLTLSGRGRPLAVEIDAFGNASVAGPAGSVLYSCHYAPRSSTEAEVTLINDEGTVEKWHLTFNGPHCGACSVRTERNGVLRRSAAGTFTVSPR
jgi:hypothetical protein